MRHRSVPSRLHREAISSAFHTPLDSRSQTSHRASTNSALWSSTAWQRPLPIRKSISRWSKIAAFFASLRLCAGSISQQAFPEYSSRKDAKTSRLRFRRDYRCDGCHLGNHILKHIEEQCLRSIAERPLRIRMDINEEAVSSDGHTSSREWYHLFTFTGAMARIDDYGKVRN